MQEKILSKKLFQVLKKCFKRLVTVLPTLLTAVTLLKVYIKNNASLSPTSWLFLILLFYTSSSLAHIAVSAYAFIYTLTSTPILDS